MLTEHEVQQVVSALKEARDHLEYCGYGDSWERECAIEAGLEKQIEEALTVAGVETAEEVANESKG